MAMADQGQHKSWDTKHYILAALGGTLAVTAMVIIISLVLRPAHISFSVTHASRQSYGDGTTNLKVTIAAYNPSRRCGARYQSVFVDLKNSTSRMGRDTIHADVPDGTFPNGYQLGPNTELFNTSVLLLEASMLKGGFAGRLNTSGLTVVVTAQVRFRVRMTPTRLYDIKVFCPGVHFPDELSKTSAQQGFNCSA